MKKITKTLTGIGIFIASTTGSLAIAALQYSPQASDFYAVDADFTPSQSGPGFQVLSTSRVATVYTTTYSKQYPSGTLDLQSADCSTAYYLPISYNGTLFTAVPGTYLFANNCKAVVTENAIDSYTITIVAPNSPGISS